MYIDTSSPTITNCTFSDNNAQWGGGIFNDNSSPTITNCTLKGNIATRAGGGIDNDDNSSPTITNSILWANTAPDGPEIYDDNSSSPTVTYCDIQGGYQGEGNINADPLFVDPENNDFHLKETSPCIDTGNNNVPGIPTTDFEADPRICDGNSDGTATVDMGADEYTDIDNDGLSDYWERSYFGNLMQGPDGDYDADGKTNVEEYKAGSNPAKAPVNFYVNSAVASSGDGSKWGNALKTIQEAIDAASTGDEVWVKNGTYLLSSQINVNKAVGIYGGFDGSETQREERDWANNVTTIDGQGSVYHCFYVTSDAVIDGLAITGGNADGSLPDYRGGGIYVYQSSPNIANCIISKNTADYGGGIYNYQSFPIVTNCIFTANSATSSGGGIYNKESSPTITNCTLSDNSAQWGGGIENIDNSSPTITNCTLKGNIATRAGGGIDNDDNSSPTITNCILWANTAPDGPEIYNYDTSNPTVTYCDIQRGYEGEGNISSDPLFVDPENNDFHLKETSPCIDTGNNNAADLPTTDFEADPRICDGDNDGTATVDMGADEYTDIDNDGLSDYWERSYFGNLTQGPDGDYDADGKTNVEEYKAGTNPTKAPVSFYVNAAVASSGDGTKWSNAFKTIQEAINAANISDEIWLKRGTYLLSSQITVNKAVGIYGGFDGSETMRDQRDWETNVTTIDGQDSVYHCFYVTSDATIDGLTITGGNADGSGWTDNAGGGILNAGYSPTITNCSFSGNSATNYGGGIYNDFGSSPIITNCTFSGNRAYYGGGIINFGNSSLTITNCTFSDNSAISGGGICNDHSSPTITNCTFSANSATKDGGGMYNYQSSPTITNCTISSNMAPYGAGIYNYDSSSLTITNCTFTGNSADVSGGGICNDDNSSPIITGCTFSGNNAGWGSGIKNNNSSSPTITDCSFTENIAVNRGGGIYNELDSSPSIDSCILSDNSAQWGAGIYNYQNSSPKIINCSFSGNSADVSGGGMYNNDESSPTIAGCIFLENSALGGGGIFNDNSSPTITNCTFSANSATKEGGAMYNVDKSLPTITNCILWGDTATDGPEVYDDEYSFSMVTYCDVQGAYQVHDNINTDPLFVDPENGDFHLQETSPCIDMGNNTAPGIPTTDVDADPRIYDGNADGTATVDIGSDEYTTTHVLIYGDLAPFGSPDGVVNVGDALVALRLALGIETATQEDIEHGDVAPLNAAGYPAPDGVITVGDALVILRKALGIIVF